MHHEVDARLKNIMPQLDIHSVVWLVSGFCLKMTFYSDTDYEE